MPEENESSGLLSNIVKLLPLYAVYVFLAGWTFSDYYYRYFGVNPRWLDIALHDTLTRGFTILFAGGKGLWLVYGLMVLVPVVSESVRGLQNHMTVKKVLDFGLIILLVAIFVLIYWISRGAGITQAQVDKGKNSTLPTINFSFNKHPYRGQLLFVRNGVYYVHDVQPKDESRKLKELSIFRAEELSDITIVEFE